ncbi:MULTISPECIES: glycerol kinase GlpK [unclassified Legionella]|uniref:glycerol kinase GlpK n=1 Tax=unclassified Legionella TaxID=2622702 RepID=UPI00105486F1|nr:MULTISPECIES: glycerol kinase GlpK [unclassified Legionella]MDI9819723.1 glycerol kinase GlpK [Legionella sp. PL877]
MNYILAIDQGTSSTRAMVYTPAGELLATSQYPLEQFYPKLGWVEHDPEEIWQKTLTAMQDVVAQVGIEKIITCGITNQRETTLIWDKQSGKCLAPAIVWQDRRTALFCQSLSDYAGSLYEKTGLFPDPYFSATKLHWLLENIPEARQLAEKNQLAFGTIDSFLIWRLTKGKSHLTDMTNASRTLLFNIYTQEWDEELLKLFNIPRSVLPEVCASDDQFGVIESEHLGLGIPITGVAGDQQAALIGQRCFENGMTKATFGTGGFLLMNTGQNPVQSQHKLLTTIAYRVKGQTAYGLEGSIYHAGTTIKWLRDELKLIETAEETEVLARSLTGNEGVYLVPSFTGLGAPHWLPVQGAMIIGLSRTSNRAHLARAALESVCYQTRDVLDCMRSDSRMEVSLLRVDGGMAANQWFLQYLASQCDLTVQLPVDIETTAQGAAILAALGHGIVSSTEALQKSWSYKKEYKPEMKNHMVADYEGWKNALRLIKQG